VSEITELQARFSDLLNYRSDDISSPIDPLTWSSPEGDTCLHYAAMRGDCDSIRTLVKLGIDVDTIGDMGRTALHCAKSAGQIEAAQTLTELGASQSIRDEFGNNSGE
jgi:ankyrin repeat protein